VKALTVSLTLLAIFSSAHSMAADPSINEAPGKGEQATLSPFRHTVPDLYDLAHVPVEQMGPGITRQTIHNAQSTMARWVFAKDAVVPLHHHANEQITWITSGAVEVLSQGKRFVVKGGQVIVFPPNVPHEFRSLQDGTVDIDIFTPARQDWIDGTATYIKPKT
jgi:quercetin dioxygenase-like cupin family protein